MLPKNYLLIILAILIVALGSYSFINRQQLVTPEEISAPPIVSKPLTSEEIAEISAGLTASVGKELSSAEKQKIEKTVTAPSQQSNLSRGDTEKLLDSLTAPR